MNEETKNEIKKFFDELPDEACYSIVDFECYIRWGLSYERAVAIAYP